MKTTAFTKILQPSRFADYIDREFPVYVKVSFDGKRLSISGVEGPRRNGDAHGSCGQIALDASRPAEGWDFLSVCKLAETWARWHLNDMRAGCEHQRAEGWTHVGGKDVIGKPCPSCGYKYGTAWLFEEVPADVLEYLRGLPEATTKPAWV